jgi:hypothetical protein
MEKLRDQLLELSDCLINYSKAIYDKLQTGLSAKEVSQRLESENMFSLSISELFMWKNGIRNAAQEPVGKYDICTQGRLISLDEAIEHFYIYTKNGLWRKDLFPIISNYGGDFVLVDVNETSPTFNTLLLYSPSLQLNTPQTIYDSLGSFVQTIIECFESGIYRYNEEEGFLEVDYDAEARVSLKKNPNSEWWQ